MEDPHWWHSVGNVRKAVGVVRDAFAKADAADKDFYAKTAAAYLAKLDTLERELKLKVGE